MRQRFRYKDGMVIGEDGMPMLNQAERAEPPQAPFTISDCQPFVMSMTNGQHYDSKSEMRKEYRRAGVVEVGNDVQHKRAAPSRDERERVKKERKASIGRALSRAGFGAP